MPKDTKFIFNANASSLRFSDEDLIVNLQAYAKSVSYRRFTVEEYDSWAKRKGCGATIIRRFGSWRRALRLIGIEGVRPFKYTPEECMDILEDVWQRAGYPPGRRKLAKMGNISESAFERYWDSLNEAKHRLADYKNGKIGRETLISPTKAKASSASIPITVRWAVLKRDHYKCVKCGQSPANGNQVELEVDHIHPRSKGGENDISNLQTLCRKCNQGKKDRLPY